MKKVIKCLLYVALALFCVLVMASALLHVEYVKKPFIGFLINQVEKETGWHLELDDVTGLLPFYLHVNNVRANNDDKNIVLIQSLKIGLSPLGMLQGRVLVKSLKLSGVHVSITSEPSKKNKPNSSNYFFPLPVQLKISRIVVNDLTSVFNGNEWHIDSLEGSLNLDPINRKSTIAFLLNQQTHGLLTAREAKGVITVEVSLEETDRGFFAETIGMKHSSSLKVVGILSGTLESWSALSKDNVVGDQASLAGELAVILGNDLHVESKVHILNGKIRIEDVNAKIISLSQPIEIKGDISLDKDFHIDDGQLYIHALEMNLLSTLIGMPTEGKLNLNLSLTKGALLPTAILDVNVAGLKFGEYSAEQLNAHSQLEYVAGSLQGQAMLSGTIQTLPFVSSFDIFWDLGSWIKLLKTTVEFPRSNLSGNIEIGIFREKNEYEFNFSDLNGTINDKKFRTEQPLSIRVQGEALELSRFSINIDNVLVEGFFNYHPSLAEGMLSAQNFPLSWAQEFYPQISINGQASLQATLTGSPTNPLATLKLKIEEAKIHDDAFSKIASIHVESEAILKNHTLAINGVATGIGPEPITFQSFLPVKAAIYPPNLAIESDSPLSADLKVDGEISQVLRFFKIGTDTISFTGFIHAILNVIGTWKDPQITAQIQVDSGAYENLDTGGVLKNIHALIVGDGKELILKELSGVDGDSGKVRATGKMLIDSSKNFPFELDADIDNGAIVHLDYARAKATGHLSYKGDLDRALLKGEFNIDRATITLPQETPAQLNSIDVVYLNQPPGEPLPAQYNIERKTDLEISLDLKLHIPSKMFIEGRDISSEWKGEILITGTTDDPLLHGECKIIKGEFNFNGKKFDTEGTITFAGDPASKTTLYVIAHQEISNIKIEAILKGPVNDPVVTFRSNPPLPQREIISWLLFNKGASEVNPIEGEELKQSMITLSSGNSGSDVLGKIRRSIGIDRIDISNDGGDNVGDTNAVSLHVGKYISKGVFVSLKKSITADANNQVSIEASITPRLKVQAEIADDSTGKMTLKWVKDY